MIGEFTSSPLLPDAEQMARDLVETIDKEILENIVQDAKELHKEARNHLRTTFLREKALRENRRS